jgi:uncharacterized SAM-dependent methyltransferase
MNRELSRLQTPMPDSTLFTVEHREPNFRPSRTHVAKGKADELSIALTTDGTEVVSHGSGKTTHRRAPAADSLTLRLQRCCSIR